MTSLYLAVGGFTMVGMREMKWAKDWLVEYSDL
jgi:hypothetical protein